jgi:FtsH-binding integral membrane protein
MDNNLISPQTVTAEQAEELQRAFVVKVYGWMTAGLLITGAIALLTLQTPGLLEAIFSSRLVFFGIVIAQLGLVIWLSTRVEKMTAVTATTVFLGYSALTGLTMSVVFLAYTSASIASTFFVTAGTFGSVALFGYVTKRDLTGLGGFMSMGLIGLILASVVNMFFNNPTVYWITTYIGILIFVGLTAYDAQKIKQMSALSLQGGEVEQKGAIMGALRLYLDFINLFLMMLRVMGSRK